MKKNALVKLVVLVCICMQAMALLPHHHHDGSQLPCVNIFHCGDSDNSPQNHGCQSGCCHGAPADSHRHDGTDANCMFARKDVIHSMRDENHETGFLPVDILLSLFFVEPNVFTADQGRLQTILSSLVRKRYKGSIPIHTTYITAAIPPRAPSFTV